MIDQIKSEILKINRDSEEIQEKTGRIQAKIIEKNKKISLYQEKIIKA